jgi:hypothetical protein
MRKKDIELIQKLKNGLLHFSNEIQPLLGIQSDQRINTFINQLVESSHRVEYLIHISSLKIDEVYANPNNEKFNPIRAAIYNKQCGNINEAFWLVFLLTHFGRHRISGWHYVKVIYGQLGENSMWNWTNICENVSGFRNWLNCKRNLINIPNTSCGFGNHRKYTSLDALSNKGTGAIIQSYVEWIGPTHNHETLFNNVYLKMNEDSVKTFDYLYNSMNVKGFGRTGRFDYLSTIGLLNLFPIHPKSSYLHGATGPLWGAQLLFNNSKKSNEKISNLEKWLSDLDQELNVGMIVIEDALCNWQKNPDKFVKFRG